MFGLAQSVPAWAVSAIISICPAGQSSNCKQFPLTIEKKACNIAPIKGWDGTNETTQSTIPVP
jgi:hypothetical protein